MKIGFLGAGHWATGFALAAAGRNDVQCTGIYAPDSTAARLAERIGAPVASTPDEVIADADAVLVGSPTDTHPGYILQASRAGKAVLCSSPVALSDDSIDAPRAACSFPWRFTPEFRKLRDAAASGELGTIGMIRLGLCRPIAQGWQNEESRSGGLLLDCGSLVLDYLCQAFGPLERAFARDVHNKGAQYALIICRLQSGAIAHLELSRAEAPGVHYDYFEVAGSTGLIDFDTRNEPILTLEPRNGPGSRSIGSGISHARSELDEFLKFVKNEKSSIATLDEGLAAVRQAVSIRDGTTSMNAVELAGNH